jgi:hypothetical protein
VADWDDVRRLVRELPGTTEQLSRGHAFWRVRGHGFVWARPLRKTDLAELGASAPAGPGVRRPASTWGHDGAMPPADPPECRDFPPASQVGVGFRALRPKSHPGSLTTASRSTESCVIDLNRADEE